MIILFRVVALAIAVFTGTMAWGQRGTTVDLATSAQRWAGQQKLAHSRTGLHQSTLCPLDQINTQNVKSLALRWKFRTGISERFRQLRWLLTASCISRRRRIISSHSMRAPANNCGATNTRSIPKGSVAASANRGAGMGYGKVFMATADAHLIAVDQKTGKASVECATRFDRRQEKLKQQKRSLRTDPLRKAVVTGASGVGANMAPLVYDGKVIVGVTGAGYGLIWIMHERQAAHWCRRWYGRGLWSSWFSGGV